MQEMNDAGELDLGLLRCFAALHRERHLSRAAERIGLSQPAMSRALGRLRSVFGDPLFVREPRGMLPTVRADQIAPQVAGVLEAAGALVRPTVFEPARLVRELSIGAADDFGGFAAPLISILAREAPGVTLVIRPLVDAGDGLSTGELDLVISVRRVLPPDARSLKLYDDSFACVVRADHPRVGKRLSLERYLELSHLLIAPRGTAGGIVDRRLAELGLARRVVARTHTFLSAPAIVAATDLVLTAPSRVLAPVAESFGLRLLPPPLELPSLAMYAAWHARVHDDPVHAWLRAQLFAACRRQP